MLICRSLIEPMSHQSGGIDPKKLTQDFPTETDQRQITLQWKTEFVLMPNTWCGILDNTSVWTVTEIYQQLLKRNGIYKRRLDILSRYEWICKTVSSFQLYAAPLKTNLCYPRPADDIISLVPQAGGLDKKYPCRQDLSCSRPLWLLT